MNSRSALMARVLIMVSAASDRLTCVAKKENKNTTLTWIHFFILKSWLVFLIQTFFSLFIMAGLQVPVDQPCIALQMVGQITQSPAAEAAASAKQDQKSKHEKRKVW